MVTELKNENELNKVVGGNDCLDSYYFSAGDMFQDPSNTAEFYVVRRDSYGNNELDEVPIDVFTKFDGYFVYESYVNTIYITVKQIRNMKHIYSNPAYRFPTEY